ncbi:MarR family winged helix-turn-helix transcriptional regulator [Roseomonas sp. CCTCC AB2023176]|uniref:MarR family winged helix-turn-helix transcriptional regulator n=1 Tax=Roseomonas sp. CCTCC AB2023176 TaxID=3342640 RepID=UPI0035D909E3
MPALDSITPGTAEPDLLPFSLNRLMAAWNARLAARLEERGVTFPQWRVLMVASRAEGALTIVELAERTLVPHSTLSRQVAAMERAGLVRREPSEDDARAVRVVLTPTGRARYREILPLALDETEQGLSPLTEPERKTLARLVARLSDATP